LNPSYHDKQSISTLRLLADSQIQWQKFEYPVNHRRKAASEVDEWLNIARTEIL
jgi:hypothetical protein